MENNKDSSNMNMKIVEITEKLYKQEIDPNEAERLLLDLFAVSGSLPPKDEVVGKGFNNANGSEYNRRNVLRDSDDDLYYTGWMDCFDWLVGNDRQLPVSGLLPCYHNFIQKDAYWKSCTHCGMLAPLWQ
jgi:hypothetical protein